MTFPRGYTARVAREADIDGMLAVYHADDVVAVGEPDTPRDFIEEIFASPFLDLARDIWLVEDARGTPVACLDIKAVDPRSSCDAFVRVHPDHRARGIGSALLDLAESRARERAGGVSTRFWATADPADVAAVDLLRSRGGEHVRSFFHMERALDGVGMPTAPDGVRLRPFQDDTDDWATFHEVLEGAFADHFGFESLDLDTFVRMWTGSPTWDPALVTFAAVEDRVVGVVASAVMSTPGLGWVGDVGVLPPFRGRGIARVLLERTFAELSMCGCSRVRLNVDAGNTTGATRLYERVGMHIRRRWAMFEKRLAPAH